MFPPSQPPRFYRAAFSRDRSLGNLLFPFWSCTLFFGSAACPTWPQLVTHCYPWLCPYTVRRSSLPWPFGRMPRHLVTSSSGSCSAGCGRSQGLFPVFFRRCSCQHLSMEAISPRGGARSFVPCRHIGASAAVAGFPCRRLRWSSPAVCPDRAGVHKSEYRLWTRGVKR